MSSKDVRRGVTNAKFNEEQSNILMAEFLIIAVAIGIYSQSWWVFGGVTIFLIASLQVPHIAIPLMIILSLAWGLIGYAIGTLFDSTGAMFVLAILGFISGLGTHFAALDWANDIGSDD